MDNEPTIQYILINRENPNNCTDFIRLGMEYMKETVPDWSSEKHEKFLTSILNRQGEKERWLVGLQVNNRMVGFAHFKIDRSERIGWGYILEFYIIRSYRRKGLGRTLYDFIKQEFANYRVKNIWLSADKVNGEPFWFSMGFMDTGETEDEKKILQISM